MALITELILQCAEPAAYGAPPPSYDEAVNDLPPDYSVAPALAKAKISLHDSAPSKSAPKVHQDQPNSLEKSSPDVLIDFESTSGIRQHAGKKKKNAAKKAAAQDKSANDDDGEKKGTEEGQNGDGGAGDGGADGGNGGGDGAGDGGGDGGGDDWDDWPTGGNKKKNKKKKKKEEEEEEKRRQEEEEEEEERKQKEEEEKKAAEEAAAAAAAATTNNNLSWADEVNDANPDDEWAGFTTAGKKKKNKKGKVRGCLQLCILSKSLLISTGRPDPGSRSRPARKHLPGDQPQ